MSNRVTPETRSYPARPKDASSVILLRGPRRDPEVLLGRRRRDARFMPGIYVFPGGRVDRSDAAQAAAYSLRQDVLAKLSRHCPPRRAQALVWAGIRETWEETGLLIGRPGRMARADKSPLHAAYRAAGLTPHTQALDYVYRAITPTRSPIRFNTRFFLADGATARGELRKSGELQDIGWRSAAAALLDDDLRVVTRLALGEALRLWRENPPMDPKRPVKRMTNRNDHRLIALE